LKFLSNILIVSPAIFGIICLSNHPYAIKLWSFK
jgi:hypothetical protein